MIQTIVIGLLRAVAVCNWPIVAARVTTDQNKLSED